MKALTILAATSQMFNPQVDTTSQRNDVKLCMHYNYYESLSRSMGSKLVARALHPDGTPIEFWVRQSDKSWGAVLVKKLNGRLAACIYLYGMGWEEADE